MKKKDIEQLGLLYESIYPQYEMSNTIEEKINFKKLGRNVPAASNIRLGSMGANMKFSSYYKLFLEKRNFYYTVPVDKEKLLYDFYTIEMLNHFVKRRFDANNLNRTMSGFDPDDPEYVSLEEARKTLLPFLKNEMLDAMFISSSCEMKHAIDFINFGALEYTVGFKFNGSKSKESFLSELTSEQRNIFESYEDYYMNLTKNYKLQSLSATAPSTGERHAPTNNTVNDSKGRYSSTRMSSIKAANRAGKEYGKSAVMRMFHSIFMLKGLWPKAYGGSAWASIAECYEDLNNTTNNLDRMTVYIDHAYDLQHNTGSVFNKLSTYLKDSSYNWIVKALDYKYKANPWDLSAKSSGILPRLSKIILARARVPKPSEQEDTPESSKPVTISQTSQTISSPLTEKLNNMDDDEFRKYIDDIYIIKLLSKNIVSDKPFFEHVSKIPREDAKAIMKRSLSIKDKHNKRFLVETLTWTFPFKFYTIDSYMYQVMNGLGLKGPALGIINAKDLVEAFYKEPNGQYENKDALNSLEDYVSDHIADFIVDDYNNIQGDSIAVQDTIEFLTNLQKKGKISSDPNSNAVIVINSYKPKNPSDMTDLKYINKTSPKTAPSPSPDFEQI